ncbi:MAG TPA: YXWGXW repeat-containing protein [Chthoniobacterales bacterium]|nr:YXWGXW repeat-containing protein [Chthoniobacterales bacterium]
MLNLISARYLSLLGFLLGITPSLFAQSISIAPPPLVVYEQPPCPDDGYFWIPGYWAYDADEGYYWVPGYWVEPPEPGLLWTPGYWGYAGGFYGWHAGYWGSQVGYYGGINYGHGYFGRGFGGGRWENGAFHYNTAVWRVNSSVVHNTYVDRTVINNSTVVNNHVSFNGPRGVDAKPTAAEEAAAHANHIEATDRQRVHEDEARRDPNQRYSANHGHPNTAVQSKVGGNNEAQHPAVEHHQPEHGAVEHHQPEHAAVERHQPEHVAVEHRQPEHAAVEHPHPEHAAPVHHAAPRPSQPHPAKHAGGGEKKEKK